MKYIFGWCFIVVMSFLPVYGNETIEDKIADKQQQIEDFTTLIDERSEVYKEDFALIERKLNIERQVELNDCAKREIECTNSSAERKYAPIFEELRVEYDKDISPRKSSIESLADQIRQIQQAEIDRKQAELDLKIQEGVVSPISADSLSTSTTQKIEEIQKEITELEIGKQKVVDQYGADVARMQAEFDEQRQSELDDCAKRNISCLNSFAKRKYEPLFEMREREYFEELFLWTEQIRDKQWEIREVIAEEEQKRQELIDNRTDEEVRQDQQIILSIEQSEKDLAEADGYFENKSYKNALIFYEKSCQSEFSQKFLCYRGIARTQEQLQDFDEAFKYYKLVLNETYTNEDRQEVEESLEVVHDKIKQITRLETALQKVIENINKKYVDQQLIKKRDFFDTLIVRVNKIQNKNKDPDIAILLNYITESFRDERAKVVQEINDIYK